MEFTAKFGFGVKVKDTISGVVGTVTAFAAYHGGDPTRYRLTYATSVGGICDDWIEEHRLELWVRGAESAE